jgi:hypothetical protein
MKRARILAAFLLGLSFSLPAVAAISLDLAQTATGIRSTACPAGDCPIVGCTPPTGFTEVNLGNGGGEICEQSASEFDLNVFGTSQSQNNRIAHKDCGGADCQIEANITDTYAGTSENFAAVGVGIREAATSTAWFFQCYSFQNGATAVQCTYGANGTYTSVNGASGQTRPRRVAVTYDVSSGDVKGFASSDGVTWVEVTSTNRALSDDEAYIMGTSKHASQTLQATLDNFAVVTTIDAYTPSDPPGGSPPTLVTPILNQTGTQGIAFAFLCSGNFSGQTLPYSQTGLPGAGGLVFNASTCAIDGTPNAADVSASPFQVEVCAANVDGETCDTAQFTFSPPSGSGDVFLVPDVADSALTNLNCSTTGGANGASWASIRTSGSGTTVGPGDIIQLASGSRGAVHLQSCNGDEDNYILVTKSVSATRLTITGQGGSNDAKLCDNCTYVHFNGLVNWTGHTAGCGRDSTFSETPLTDCGILVDATNQFALKMRGEARFIIWEGIEVDGNWPQTISNTGADVAISPNDQDYCVSNTPSLLNREFREGLIVRNNYFHHLAHEIAYFGPNVNYGNCSAGEGAPRLKDITIADNFMQYGGWDGLNLKSAITGTNVIEGNVILDIGGGTTASGANSVGIALFEAEGVVRYNKVRRTSDPPGGANGIHAVLNAAPAEWGTLDVEIYGNEVADTDGRCIHVGDTAAANYAVQIYSNTLVDCSSGGVNVTSTVTGTGFVRDNLSTGSINEQGPNTANQNNRVCVENACGFVDEDSDGNVNDNDYSLTSGSASRNNASNCPSVDLLGAVRPKGANCDQGAYEFNE